MNSKSLRNESERTYRPKTFFTSCSKIERYHYFQSINGPFLQQLRKARMIYKKLFLSNTKYIFEMTS